MQVLFLSLQVQFSLSSQVHVLKLQVLIPISASFIPIIASLALILTSHVASCSHFLVNHVMVSYIPPESQIGLESPYFSLELCFIKNMQVFDAVLHEC